MQKVKLSQLLKTNNYPKIFFLKSSNGREVVFADTNWLAANFLPLGQKLYDDVANEYWGTKNPMNTYHEVENDTDTYSGLSIDTAQQKDEILAEIAEYKTLSTIKIEILVA
jgi:hypothetical protein